jgi:hypothetical protein
MNWSINLMGSRVYNKDGGSLWIFKDSSVTGRVSKFITHKFSKLDQKLERRNLRWH